MIAALYVVLVEVFKPISYGMVQVRVAEALTVLPYFTFAAIPGLTLGVIISNIIGPYGMMDIVFGSSATLIAAYLSYKMPKKVLVPIPPIVVNAIIIGAMLYYIFLGTPDAMPLLPIMGWVGIGQVIVCYGLGYPLIKVLEKHKDKLFQ
ncbi:MAG: QueT transporter family protein [Clostridiaceae bacterium]|nr:QueT transporter family protein [Clostridiaceae bacterium]